MQKLKYKEVREYREKFLEEQENRCGLCGDEIEPEKAVLDHDHKSGQLRSVLHRGCNALLGKIENSMPMNQVDEQRLSEICKNLVEYRHKKKDLLHPTFKDKKTKKSK